MFLWVDICMDVWMFSIEDVYFYTFTSIDIFESSEVVKAHFQLLITYFTHALSYCCSTFFRFSFLDLKNNFIHASSHCSNLFIHSSFQLLIINSRITKLFQPLHPLLISTLANNFTQVSSHCFNPFPRSVQLHLLLTTTPTTQHTIPAEEMQRINKYRTGPGRIKPVRRDLHKIK